MSDVPTSNMEAIEAIGALLGRRTPRYGDVYQTPWGIMDIHHAKRCLGDYMAWDIGEKESNVSFHWFSRTEKLGNGVVLLHQGKGRRITRQ